MCFKVPKGATVKVAKKDITCWKLLNPDLSPYFTGNHGITKPYEKDKINKKQTLHIINNEINKGYHSYKTKTGCNKERKEYSNKWRGNPITKKFIIPAGTAYYENRTEYVSENIILTK